jgi:hypothetical protein
MRFAGVVELVGNGVTLGGRLATKYSVALAASAVRAEPDERLLRAAFDQELKALSHRLRLVRRTERRQDEAQPYSYLGSGGKGACGQQPRLAV